MSEIERIDNIKKYIRANIDEKIIKCRNCGKDIIRYDLRQIVYFCSKACRKNGRKI